MMISPEMYYDKYLRGRSQKKILDKIHSLQQEIYRLKKELEELPELAEILALK